MSTLLSGQERQDKEIRRRMNQMLINIAVGKLFNNRCYVCHKEMADGFVFHHISYPGKSYKEFKNKEKYQLYLKTEILTDPKNFRLLCKGHHYAVEKMKRFKKANLQRLCKVALDSHPGDRK